jgi:aminopeptidase-like protein
MLDHVRSAEGAADAVRGVWPLTEAMYPICRSITGNGVRRTLDLVEQWIVGSLVQLHDGANPQSVAAGGAPHRSQS